MTSVLTAIAAGAFRSVEVELQPTVYAPCMTCTGAHGELVADEPDEVPCADCAGSGESDTVAVPRVALSFRVQKLTTELLAEQGTAILFTDLPANLGVLMGGDEELASLDKLAKSEGDTSALAKDTQEKLQLLRGLGPRFFKTQAKHADAVVCAGVVAVWQVWGGPEDKNNPAPGGSPEQAEADGGYWTPCTFTNSRGTEDVSRGRLPLSALSKGARETLAHEISAFSLSDGGIANAMRGFRRDA